MNDTTVRTFGTRSEGLGEGLGEVPAAPAGGGIRPGAEPVKGLRFLSGLVDLVVLFVATVILVMILGLFLPVGEGDDTADAILGLLVVLLWFGYGLVMDARGGTVGKLVTGTRVVDESGRFIGFGRSLGRNLGKLLSAVVPFYIPYFMVLFTERSQTLHDMMAKTLVYKKDDLGADAAVFD